MSNTESWTPIWLLVDMAEREGEDSAGATRTGDVISVAHD